jgi:hypothetical protein
MKYAVEMGSGAMIYTPKFHKDWFRQLEVDRAGIQLQIQTVR